MLYLVRAYGCFSLGCAVIGLSVERCHCMSLSLVNLIFLINMSSYHLRKTEVIYELKVRNIPVEGTAGELRKRLSQALATNVEVDAVSVDMLVPESELEECEGKLQDLSSMVADYEGNYRDNECGRIQARLWHLFSRVERIPIGAVSKEVEENKGSLLEKSKDLLEAFEKATTNARASGGGEHKIEGEKFQGTTPSSQKTVQYQGLPTRQELEDQRLEKERCLQEDSLRQKEERFLDERRQQEEKWKERERELQEEWMKLEKRKSLMDGSPGVACLQKKEGTFREDRKSQPRYVPVYKWGLQFDGQSQSIGAFLQRVEETRRARGVTPEELFDSAVDLFSGAALVWYRSTIGRISTWGSLCLEMKIVFQSPDHDIRLQQEIFNRVQGETEHIDLFIASMEGLYGRLSTTVQEEVRLKQIFHNLNPQLQDRLALFDLTSIEQLRRLGRKAEAGRFRSTVITGSSRRVGTLEPDLAYEPARWKKPQLASVDVPPKKEIRANCWNCGDVGHRHNTCQKEKKKFCFGCGAPDVIKPNCPKCSKCNKCVNCPKNA